LDAINSGSWQGNHLTRQEHTKAARMAGQAKL
jgi:hypothetical protein